MMDAVKCMKAVTQMLQSGTIDCAIQKYISAQKKNDYEGMVEAAEQWAAEHPVKTRQSEFLKLFPGVDVYETDGCLTLNPCIIYEKMRKECAGKLCSECRRAFWLAEVEE
jgi:hypothetical protein